MSSTTGGQMEGEGGGSLQGPALSLNSMQLAIISLKEKYHQKQKQVDILEGEKNQLILSKENLYNELKKLHEANEKLREQNLKLSTDLEIKSKECTSLYQRLQDQGLQGYSRLYESSDVSTLSNDFRLGSRIEDSATSLPNPLKADQPLPQLRKYCRLRENLDNLPQVEESASERILVEQVANNFNTIRDKLRSDQERLAFVLKSLQTSKDITDKNVNKLIAGLRNCKLSSIQKSDTTSCDMRRCPMCEAEFPLNTSQDEFELHVVEHFSFEESETLKNFDTLPDAYFNEKKEAEVEKTDDLKSNSA
eukprot:TRINITY_DN3263_c0_g1_i1.p1 TRINITY_DN3263_c0_g1~~TRINITY_DN3263_c0_g1_i1.p1  ORF type:complete len:307 (-),score=37.46 TRINITY_DN3263_c0_g1_i1:472-1392(-)